MTTTDLRAMDSVDLAWGFAESTYKDIDLDRANSIAEELRRRDAEVKALVEAAEGAVEQLSPSVVDVVIKPGCEPFSIKQLRTALAAFKP